MTMESYRIGHGTNRNRKHLTWWLRSPGGLMIEWRGESVPGIAVVGERITPGPRASGTLIKAKLAEGVAVVERDDRHDPHPANETSPPDARHRPFADFYATRERNHK